MRIVDINSWLVYDSRGLPTVCVEVNGSKAIVPSGASVGSKEALELRDGDADYNGKGVKKALKNLDQLKHVLIGHTYTQSEFDQYLIQLDNTHNKSNLGANVCLGLSLAFSRALSKESDVELYESFGLGFSKNLPVPLMNVINGGAHVSGGLDIQEFMIVPHGFASISDSLKAGSEIYLELKSLLVKRGISVAVGDEGGIALVDSTTEQALDLICSAIENSAYKISDQVSLALDVASTEFFRDGLYKTKAGTVYDHVQWVDYLASLCKKYPILSIEDGMSENDWQGWRLLNAKIGTDVQIVGDDLLVTNISQLELCHHNQAANSILIKPNQVGTVSETLDTIKLANKFGYSYIISHRSGDSEDSFIADLSVGTGSGLIKTGPLVRSERVCKYNRLLEIEHKKPQIPFSGSSIKYKGY